MDDLTARMQDLKQSIQRAVQDAASAADTGSTVNVAGRRNVVVARNVGGPGGRETASAQQRVRVRQDDGRTVEEHTSSSTADGTGR